MNKNGAFNVPIGTKDSVILPTDNFEKISEILQYTELKAIDFEDTIKCAEYGDFLFVDPPYTVLHNYNGFIKYNQNLFTWKDQKRLVRSLRSARSRGASILLLNADHDSVYDLYSDFADIRRVSRYSVIAAETKYRRQSTELVIRSLAENSSNERIL